MGYSVRAFGVAVVSGLALGLVADECHHNNCLRAVIADSVTTRSGVADCGKFLDVTVTPPTSTSYTTVAETTLTLPAVTVTETVEPGGLKARTFTVTEVEPTPEPSSSVGGTTFPAYATACTGFPDYVSACSCVGVTASTTVLPSPSITATVTAGTDTVSPTVTATVTNIVVNGGFETGDWAPWVPTTGKYRAYGNVKEGGEDSTWAAVSNNMYDNNLWEFYQNLHGVKGTTYSCSYDWKFTAYYDVTYKDGNDYVPYIHGYVNNKIWTIDIPDPRTVNEWHTTTFEFKSKGTDTWWFDCASPQPRCGSKRGSNYLSIDNVSCIAKSQKK